MAVVKCVKACSICMLMLMLHTSLHVRATHGASARRRHTANLPGSPMHAVAHCCSPAGAMHLPPPSSALAWEMQRSAGC